MPQMEKTKTVRIFETSEKLADDIAADERRTRPVVIDEALKFYKQHAQASRFRRSRETATAKA